MKGTARSAIGFAFCLAMSARLAPTNAMCGNARLILGCAGDCSYLLSPGVSGVASFRGSFWALGSGDPEIGLGDDNGSDLATGNVGPYYFDWVHFFQGRPYLAGAWSNFGVDGCIDNTPNPMRTAIGITDADAPGAEARGYVAFLCVTRDWLYNYDFSFNGTNVSLVSIPRPSVTESSPSGASAIRFTVAGPSPAAVSSALRTDGSCGTTTDLVTGYKVYSQVRPRASGPALDRSRSSGWNFASGPAPLGQDATFMVSHAPDTIVSLAISLVFDSGFETAHVSQNLDLCTDNECIVGDQCHDAGTCDPSSGLCSNPARPDGTPCDDGDACSSGDACADGQCEGGPTTDPDDDGVCSPADNCPEVPNPGQTDHDGDGIGDACENCKIVFNPIQIHPLLAVAAAAEPGATEDPRPCTGRYYLSPMTGTGTEGDPFRPSIADFPTPGHALGRGFAAITPADPRAGRPTDTWALVLVASRDHEPLTLHPEFIALPDLPLAARLDAESRRALGKTLARLGIGPGILGPRAVYGDVLLSIARALDPRIRVLNLFVSC